MKMIKLTGSTGNNIFINPNTIEYIELVNQRNKKGYCLDIGFCSGKEVSVQESLEEFNEALEDYNHSSKEKKV